MQTNEPLNYAGAIIFWAYIAAALCFTAVILRTITSTIQSQPQNARSRISPVLILLALSSFSTLSYHMLNVLISSYKEWAIHHDVPLPNGMFGPGSLLGPDRRSLHLWRWSITSSLFQDFGEAIVATRTRYLISAAGLSSTVAVASFIGIEGRKARIPNLWAFIALLEILPTSFSQTLFYIMLSITPRPKRNEQILNFWPIWYFIPIIYTNCLEFASKSHGTALINIILVARLLLTAPAFLPLKPRATTDAVEAHTAATSLYCFSGIMPPLYFVIFLMTVASSSAGSSVAPLLGITDTHPAVKTLGWDFLHSVVAFMYWTLMHGENVPDRSQVEERGTKAS